MCHITQPVADISVQSSGYFPLSRDPVIRGTYLPIGDPTLGFVLPIYVVITDSLGSNTHVDMEITVRLSLDLKC